MNSVQITFGSEVIQKNYPSAPTVSQIRTDTAIKAVLGYGDNVRFLIDGVEQRDGTVIPNGAKVVVETAANQKA